MSEIKDKALDFSKMLGAEALDAWESACPDPGAQFLQGASTSVLGPTSMVLDDAAAQLDTASALVGSSVELYNTATSLDFSQYASVIKQAAIDMFKTEVKDYFTEKYNEVSAEVLSIGTTYFPQRVAYWTGTFTKTNYVDFLTEMMGEPADKKAMREQESALKNSIKDKISDVSAKIGAVKDVVSSASDLALTGIENTITYMQAGPKYVEDNLNKYMKLAITPVQKEIDANLDAALEEGYKAADAAAQKIGYGAAEVVNKGLKFVAQKTKASTKKAMVTIVSFAKSVVEIVKLAALALIGG